MANSRIKYSDEEILEQMRDHYRSNSGISVLSFSSDKKTCSVSTVSVRFGSWENALKKAGVEPRIKLTKEVMVKQIKEHYLKNEQIDQKSFDKDESTCSSSYVSYRFNGWNRALEEAGIKDKREYVEYEKDRLLKILKEKAKTGEFKHKYDVIGMEGIPSYQYI